MPLSIRLAYAYLRTLATKQSLSTMIKICFISIFLGTISLALSLFIMSGFEEATKEKLRNINPPIIIQPASGYLNYEKMAPILKDEFNTSIQAFSPTATQYGIIKTTENIDLSAVSMIQAVDPRTEGSITHLEKYIQATMRPYHTLEELLAHGVLIGKKRSIAQGIFPGDFIEIVFAKPKKKNIDFESIKVRVTGIFSTGIDDLDTMMVISSLSWLKEIYPDLGINQIGIQPRHKKDEALVIEALKRRFAVDVYAWQDLYPSLVSVLKLEKYVVFAVLTLLMIIASMNLISLIFMLIMQKRRDLALLLSMGMSIRTCQGIFIIMSLLITALSTGIGLACAYGIGLYLHHNPIELPDAYYVSYLPITLDAQTTMLIFVVALSIALITSLVPIKNIKQLSITEILRAE